MKRKLLIGLMALTCATTLTFGLAACADNSDKTDDGKPSTDQPNYTPSDDGTNELLKFELNEDESGYVVTGLAEGVTDANIKIPATYQSLPVVSIGERAFGSCHTLTSVTISEGVTTIGSGAFIDCINIPSFKFPDSITVIGDSAFQNCNGLKTVRFNETSKLEEISSNAFQNCTGLTGFDMPAGVVTVGDRAFQNCTAIKSLTIGNSVETIGIESFRGCSALASVELGDSLIEVGAQAFLNCSLITEMHFPDTLEKVGLGALKGCTGIKNITIPFVGAEKYDTPVPEAEENSAFNTTNFGYIYGATSYRENYTANFGALETVTITGNSPIGYHAFQSIGTLNGDQVSGVGLHTIIITGNVKVLGTGAFAGCYNLQTVVIPKSVTTIGGQVLAETLIKRFYYCGSEADYSSLVSDGGAANNMHLYGRAGNADPRYYYSETAPSTSGNFWHYVDGVPTDW